MSSKGSYIKNLRKCGRINVSSTGNVLVKCTKDNCTEEDIHLHFRLSTRCSSYFAVIVVNLTEKLKNYLTKAPTTIAFVPLVQNPY